MFMVSLAESINLGRDAETSESRLRTVTFAAATRQGIVWDEIIFSILGSCLEPGQFFFELSGQKHGSYSFNLHEPGNKRNITLSSGIFLRLPPFLLIYDPLLQFESIVEAGNKKFTS